ncbi:hypothetical protein RHSIM_Rhsim04G0006800 [Rhododendron simsii]|uniref:F-box domain-containing protein n=1 Tax=Rhododendron simsii TaxID=118357 RepID=A0A834LSC7_RHOSS|nr:hypothetical protein RHSIM_Rhsim04G0006800 [Rhododendron simsii]
MSKRAANGGGGEGGGLLERLPNTIINEILGKLELETLCSAACVSRTLRSSASQVLSSLTTLDLSLFSPDVQTLEHILHRCSALKRVTVDCLRLGDSSVCSFLGEQIEELNLLKGSSLSYQVLFSIGRKCPNLRVLVVELAGWDVPKIFTRCFMHLLNRCSYLESLCIKIRGSELDASGFLSSVLSVPNTVKVLKLQPLLIEDAVGFINDLPYGRNALNDFPFYPLSPRFTLQKLSLVVDVISNELIISISNFVPLLVELDLEDRPCSEPQLPKDLTNSGLQRLGSCQHLIALSLLRSKLNCQVSFKAVNDMGMFLLSESCKGLQAVRLGGFSKVSDAGFAAILHSCRNLKKFEVRNASLLSDLAFLNGALPSLVDMKLWSCSLITSESVNELATSSDLEVLDLSGCRSIADSCLGRVTSLHRLTTLNIGGSDITDGGLAIIGRGNSPITHLCLSCCKRVTDKGIALLFRGGGKIREKLWALDVGYIPGISDRAIFTIAEFATSVTELCIRYCYSVTDASLEILASERRFEDGKKLVLRRLDLCSCVGLSVKSYELLKKPFFSGLKWLGVGRTQLTSKGMAIFTQIRKERPWLTLCLGGCEMGCHDGWQFHRADCYQEGLS